MEDSGTQLQYKQESNSGGLRSILAFAKHVFFLF